MAPELKTIAEELGLLAAVIGGGVGGVMMMRRRLARDNADIACDRAEQSLVSRLQGERDAMHDEVARGREQHIADTTRIAGLLADKAHLLCEIELQNTTLRRLHHGLSHEQRQLLLETNYGPLPGEKDDPWGPR